MDVLSYIVAYKEAHDGVSPSLDDIKDVFGVSKGAARDWRDALVRDGKIEYMNGSPRSIMVVGGYRAYIEGADEAGVS